MAKTYTSLSSTIAQVVTQQNFHTDQIGDLELLLTPERTDLVAAINSINAGTGDLDSDFTAFQTATNASISALNSTVSGLVLVPIGGIIMWSGAIVDIPAGWALCDGSNGTPNLRDRFVVGAGGAYAVGNTGGLDTVTLTSGQIPSHTHPAGTLATSSAGDHAHSVSGSTSFHSAQADLRYPRLRGGGQNTAQASGSMVTVHTSGFSGISSFDGNNSTNNDGMRTFLDASHSHSFSGSSNTTGAHAHGMTGSTGAAGSGGSHENRPPYYALALIMRIA